MLHGGYQDMGLRSGTQAVPQMAAFGAAAVLAIAAAFFHRWWIVSKLVGTLPWCLYVAAISVAVYALLRMSELYDKTSWFRPLSASGTATLTVYMMPYILYSVSASFITFIIGGLAIAILGNWMLDLIHSETRLLPTDMLCTMLCVYTLGKNHAIAAGFISADNRIPFFIPSLLSGGGTVILLWLFLSIFHWGIWGMILAPGIAQLVYQNWKWPSMVIKELNSLQC